MSDPLPSLFVIGDSISIGYGPDLERMLSGTFSYARKGHGAAGPAELDRPTDPDDPNGGDSQRVLSYLQTSQEVASRSPDVLLLNCGLHDLKSDPATGAKQVPIDRYEENLRAILSFAREWAKTVYWVMTTPVADEIHNSRQRGFFRYEADVLEYNAIAQGLTDEHNVRRVELHDFTASLEGELYVDHVHFADSVGQAQAAFIAGFLLGAR